MSGQIQSPFVGRESWGERVGVVLLMLTGLTLPLSTALGCTVFPFAAVAIWLISGQFMKLPSLLRHNPVAALCAGMFLWLMVATLYSEADLSQALMGLKKYRELALVPVFTGLLAKVGDRRRVLHALTAGLGLALGVSIVQAIGLLPLYHGQPASSSSITHNTLMAWFAFWLFHEAWRRGGWLPWVVAGIATVDILILVESTTGVVLLLLGGLLFVWQILPVRRAVVASLVPILSPFLLLIVSEQFRVQTDANWQQWHRADKNIPARGGVDQRLEFWRHTADLIREAPLLGHGMGSYASHYAGLVADTNFTPTTNPHNEYLMLWAQAGLPAVILLFSIFIWQWRQAAGPERWLGQGFVVLFGLGCAFNSFILDSREGILFALLTAVLYPATPREGGCGWKTRERTHEG